MTLKEKIVIEKGGSFPFLWLEDIKSFIEEIKQWCYKNNTIPLKDTYLELCTTDGGWVNVIELHKFIDKATGFNDSPETQVQLLPAEKQSSSGLGQGLTGEGKTSPKKCIGCGCTDKQACPGGCYWMWEEYPVCSQCYEKHPGKYCKLLKKWEKERLEKKEAGK